MYKDMSKSIGYFYTVANDRAKRWSKYYVFELDDFDRDFLRPVAVPDGYVIYRVRTAITDAGGITPLVAVNFTTKYVIFADCTRDDEQVHWSKPYKTSILVLDLK